MLKKNKKSKFPIYKKYLKIKYERPITVFMGCFMPFSQAAMGAMLQIYINNNDALSTTIGSLFYWTMFAANGKRVALGGWKAIILFIIFASLGTLVGMLIANNL